MKVSENKKSPAALGGYTGRAIDDNGGKRLSVKSVTEAATVVKHQFSDQGGEHGPHR